MPRRTDNNRLAQTPEGKQKRSIIESLEFSVFISQAQNVNCLLRA